MITVLLTMFGIILLGVLWKWRLGGERAHIIRQHLTLGVYEVFLPALVLSMLWQAPVDMNTLRVPGVAAGSILLSLLLVWVLYAAPGPWRPAGEQSARHAALGALLLAATFGNVTYLGLPVLTQVFGPAKGVIAIQYDLLASTPLLFTVGVLLASHYGHTSGASIARAWRQMLQVPALWAAVLGLLLSLFAVPMPELLQRLLPLLGAAVIPLMLLAVGTALNWQAGWLARLPLMLPALLVQLLLMPGIAWLLCRWWQMPADLQAPVVVEAAMPTMVLGLVICDRFGLDTGLYAEAITLSTLLSLFTLPIWLAVSGVT